MEEYKREIYEKLNSIAFLKYRESYYTNMDLVDLWNLYIDAKNKLDIEKQKRNESNKKTTGLYRCKKCIDCGKCMS